MASTQISTNALRLTGHIRVHPIWLFSTKSVEGVAQIVPSNQRNNVGEMENLFSDRRMYEVSHTRSRQNSCAA